MIDIGAIKRLFPIAGARVRLDLFTRENITSRYLGWLNDPAVVRYSNQRFFRHTLETSVRYLESFENSPNLFLAVSLKDDGRYVGTLTVYISPPHETADIGIMIGDRTCWGTGLGGDAWRTVLSFLLDAVGMRKVTGGAVACNEGMVKIMLGSGMKPDGVRVAQELVDGVPYDILHFAKFGSL